MPLLERSIDVCKDGCEVDDALSDVECVLTAILVQGEREQGCGSN